MKTLISLLILISVNTYADGGSVGTMNCVQGSKCSVEYMKFEGMDRGEFNFTHAEWVLLNDDVKFQKLSFRAEEINDLKVLKAIEESKKLNDWVRLPK